MTSATTLQNVSTVRSAALYMAFELSKQNWYVAFSAGTADDTIVRRVPARELGDLAEKIGEALEYFELGDDAVLYSVYEAGFDAFWLHRCLEDSQRVRSFVIDPASIEVNRRGRRRKTDKLDAVHLVRKLLAYLGGDSEVFSVCVVPDRGIEDGRRIEREYQTLGRCRVAELNRVKGLLILHGIDGGVGEIVERLDELKSPDGRPLGFQEKQELRRVVQRLQLFDEQIKAVEQERRERLKANDVLAQKAAKLQQLKAIGERSAFGLVMEIFWREFRNRGQVSSFAGYDPVPYDTGQSTGRQQGISKAGSRWVRAIMHSLAGCWLQWQPDSELSVWYRNRYRDVKGGRKRQARVALARKLLVRLWRWVEFDELPRGAIVREA